MKDPDTLELEETNLVLHTRLCAQRYEQITDNFTQMEERLDRIDSTLEEIKSALVEDKKDNLKTYLAWAGSIILLLLGAVGTLISHYVLK